MEGPATYRDVFAVPEFRALWGAQLLSILGDQLASVAIAVLVFSRTGSALLTAVTYSLSFLPWLIGGPLLSGIADRAPRRSVMVRSDLARAGLVAVMAVPGVPLWLLCGLLFTAELLSSPFSAARAALLPDVLPDDRYVVASAVGGITREFGQLFGFVAGGAVALAVGTHVALAIDAITFVVSAVVVRAGVQGRPAARTPAESPRRLAEGVRVVFGDRELRALLYLAWLCAFVAVPEGLAAPLAAQLHGGAVAVGLLLAANPAGTIVGAALLARLVSPPRRLAWMRPLAFATVAPLVGLAARPGLAGTLLLLFLAGVGCAYNLPANAAFVAALPPKVRGEAFGVVQSGMYIVQGAAIVAAGAAAQVVSPGSVVAVSGLLGVLVVLVLSVGALRALSTPAPGNLPDEGAVTRPDARALAETQTFPA